MAGLFAVTTAICAIGWIINKVMFRTMIVYINKKGYTPPSDEETKACAEIAIRGLLGFKK